MASAEARRAFNIDAESASLRDEYGRTTLGQSCLMARRLVEAGVRCVTIDHVDWDTHQENFALLKDPLLPALDAAMATGTEGWKHSSICGWVRLAAEAASAASATRLRCTPSSRCASRAGP